MNEAPQALQRRGQRVAATTTKNSTIRTTDILHYRTFTVIILLLSLIDTATTKMCYSCSGSCHNELHCNCHMGSCEADYCFIEKRPANEAATAAADGRAPPALYRIVKGCVKRPSRTRLKCDYNHFASHVQCICSGNFCNEAITMRRQNPPLINGKPAPQTHQSSHSSQRQSYYLQLRPSHNVTCRLCTERRHGSGPSDCTAKTTCQGEWCHEKSSTGAAGCGFGPPTLPFFYQGPELLWSAMGTAGKGRKVCTTLSRSNGAPHTYCVCNTPMCNDAQTQSQPQRFPFSLLGGGEAVLHSSSNHRSRSVAAPYSRHRTSIADDDFSRAPLTLHECVNCDLTVEQSVFTSNCKSNRCRGHFCTYATQRVFGPAVATGPNGPSVTAGGKGTVIPTVIHERQGCMNVTDSRQVQLGCTHKWTTNEEEEIYCACRGDICNGDLTTAAASAATTQTSAILIVIFGVAATSTLTMLPYRSAIRS